MITDTPVIRVTRVKGADETVNNSQVAQADDELILTLPPGRYKLSACIMFTSSAGADFRWSLTFSENDARFAIQALYANEAGVHTGSTWLSDFGATTSEVGGFGQGATVSEVGFQGNCVIVTACTLTLNWAQSAAEVSDTIVKAGSWIEAQRV